MTIEEHIELFKRIDGLLRRKSTGNVNQMAEKLMLSKRTVMRVMKLLKQYAPIEWSAGRQSYYYFNPGRLRVMEFVRDESELELKKNGQSNQATK